MLFGDLTDDAIEYLRDMAEEWLAMAVSGDNAEEIQDYFRGPMVPDVTVKVEAVNAQKRMDDWRMIEKSCY